SLLLSEAPTLSVQITRAILSPDWRYWMPVRPSDNPPPPLMYDGFHKKRTPAARARHMTMATEPTTIRFRMVATPAYSAGFFGEWRSGIQLWPRPFAGSASPCSSNSAQVVLPRRTARA